MSEQLGNGSDGLVQATQDDLVVVESAWRGEIEGRVNFIAGDLADARERLVLLEERFSGSETLWRDTNRNVGQVLEILQCHNCKRHRKK